MKNVSRSLTVCALAVCTLMSVSLVAQQQVDVVNTPNVKVVNTPSVSVSNTPSVNVSNTPNVNVANAPNVKVTNTPNVSVTNTPNVNVANTPSVNVANTPTVTFSSGASVNVTNPPDSQGNPTPLATLEAVQVYGSSCSFAFASSTTGSCEFTAVPQGKQLVVQEFDAEGELEPGNRPTTILLFNTITGSNFFAYTLMASGNGYDYLVTDDKEMRAYVAEGEVPECGVAVVENSTGDYYCNISGYLVDVPSGSQPITVQHPQSPRMLRHLPAR